MFRSRMASIQQEAMPPIVKVDPQWERLRKSFRRPPKWLLILIVMQAVFTIPIFISAIWDKEAAKGVPSLLFLLLLNLLLYSLSWYLLPVIGKYWKRLEQRRQAAALGEPGLLADEQPAAHAQALSLPFTIRQRPRLSAFLLLLPFMIACGLILGLEITLLFAWITALSHQSATLHISIQTMLAITSLSTLVVCASSIALAYATVHEQITLTQDGMLLIGVGPKVRSIPWSEAKLFAIRTFPGAKRFPYPVQLELASSREIIRWTWIHQGGWYWRFYSAEPIEPMEAYEQHMHSILSIIAARTGLPLYDLRKAIPSDHHEG